MAIGKISTDMTHLDRGPSAIAELLVLAMRALCLAVNGIEVLL